MKTHTQKEHRQMSSSSTGFGLELRANVAIRIIVDRVELENHPLLTTDQNGARRMQWQAIASAALDQYLPGGQPQLPGTSAAEREIERKRARDRGYYHKRMALRKQRLKKAAATTETPAVTGTRQAPVFKEATCIHCGKTFTMTGPRQVYCKRKPCQTFRHNAARAKDKQRHAAAAQKGGAA